MNPRHNHTVVLLHGIGLSRWNMVRVAAALKKDGYRVLNLSYPSLRHDIKTLARWLGDRLDARFVWRDSQKVHFVGHSMGGLVAGMYLEIHKMEIPPGALGRVVMLGTPHGGSEVADFLHSSSLYKRFFGPAGQELTTRARANEKLHPYYELGLVAGSSGRLYPLGAYCIPQEHDGCVSVASTKLDGAKEHIVMPVNHGFMCWTPGVIAQVRHFLEHGAFSHAA